ncbi:MAG: large conductance mechanosensitive channel protein MscL [Agrococcus casei]|uniref:Large-conductance mechanosensitive channel n=1 Tax=Agrococcus casei LMG 22410 TaxID=1255656 RepID=A0A1R4GCF4_9MICO|nr:large conductance mechanosensitive channel protein MscL [Agrococcus casei]SJM65868.1 Large-conductance mechanosensitive channel [Agrococcus casei LMG 22410]
MKGFKAFIMQGNVIDLAVAVVIGGAFAAIVDAFVTGVVEPLIAAAGGFDNIAEVTAGPILIGLVIAAVIRFILVAAIVYFVLVLPIQKMREASDRRKGIVPAEDPESQEQILADIRELLKAQQGGKL